MIVVYHDVGGAHSTAVAANIHVGNLSAEKAPSKEEILNLPTFDKITKDQIGHLIYVGEDEFGTKVYTIGRKYNPNIVLSGIADMYNIDNGKLDGLFLINTHTAVNTWMKIGGFSSRVLGLVPFGRPIVTYGTIKAYQDIVNIVKKTKQREVAEKKRYKQ